MADITIEPNKKGSYETALAADTVQTFVLPAETNHIRVVGEVKVNAAETTPVYVSLWDETVSPKDATAFQISAGESLRLSAATAGADLTLHVVCEDAAVVSVVRV
jgi:hypothetical protein